MLDVPHSVCRGKHTVGRDSPRGGTRGEEEIHGETTTASWPARRFTGHGLVVRQDKLREQCQHEAARAKLVLGQKHGVNTKDSGLGRGGEVMAKR